MKKGLMLGGAIMASLMVNGEAIAQQAVLSRDECHNIFANAVVLSRDAGKGHETKAFTDPAGQFIRDYVAITNGTPECIGTPAITEEDIRRIRERIQDRQKGWKRT